MSSTMMYVGTYTLGKSEGIYSCYLNEQTGEIVQAHVPVKLDNPTYLHLDKKGDVLYSVGKRNLENRGEVASYSIDRQSGALTLLNSKENNCLSSCYISTDNKNQYLFTANYHDGSLSSFSIQEDGSIGNLVAVIEHVGKGVDEERQENPHVHYVNLTPDQRYLCAVDLGIDKVVFYKFNQNTGELVVDELKSLSLPPGSGPRHLLFTKKGNNLYVINELTSTIVVYTYDSNLHIYKEIQNIQTIPSDFTDENFCAAIYSSNEEEILFASNRGHDSIVSFKILENGMLELISWTSTNGHFPRDFNISPSGKFLVVANQLTDNISSYKICQETGNLLETGFSISIPSPVCIKFLAL